MFVVTRFRVDPVDVSTFRAELAAVVEAVQGRPGFLSAEVGRSADEPSLWALVAHWEGVGSYRRALSAYDVKVALSSLLARALVEPSAYVEDDGSVG